MDIFLFFGDRSGDAGVRRHRLDIFFFFFFLVPFLFSCLLTRQRAAGARRVEDEVTEAVIESGGTDGTIFFFLVPFFLLFSCLLTRRQWPAEARRVDEVTMDDESSGTEGSKKEKMTARGQKR